MTAIWTCTVGSLTTDRADLPDGCALPMSRAVEAVAAQLGLTDIFVFSGWGQDHLDESHLAVVEKRNILDDPTHQQAWLTARQIIEDFILEAPADINDGRTSAAIGALCELIWHNGRRSGVAS